PGWAQRTQSFVIGVPRAVDALDPFPGVPPSSSDRNVKPPSAEIDTASGATWSTNFTLPCGNEAHGSVPLTDVHENDTWSACCWNELSGWVGSKSYARTWMCAIPSTWGCGVEMLKPCSTWTYASANAR